MQGMQELSVTIHDKYSVHQNAQAGLLVAIDRQSEKCCKFYTIHHAAVDQIWSRLLEHSMAMHVAYVEAYWYTE